LSWQTTFFVNSMPAKHPMNRAKRGTDESLYRLYVPQEIDKGRADAKAGRTITHAEVAAELRKKWRTDDDA
jgi:hypothetical protein